jgi:8-oxo-dGTP pyrophosphatase MutT (NUDIX family)
MRPWRVERSSVLVDRRWLTVREQRIALPNGRFIEDFHVVEAPDWAAAIAVTREGRVVFVDQYRHAAARVSRELPAGMIEAGEPPLEAARRELLEETGYVAEDWQPLPIVFTEPSRQTQRAHLWVAKNARRVADQRLDESEEIVVLTLSPRDIFDAIDAGVISHGVQIGGILSAARRGLLDPTS